MFRLRRFSIGLALLIAAAVAARFVSIGSSVGAGFAAHVTCSLVFVSGQDAERAFDEYIRHYIWPLSAFLSLEVGDDAVTANVLGAPRGRAIYRPGAGCTQVHDDTPLPAVAWLAPAPARAASMAWPRGSAPPPQAPPRPIAAAIDDAFAEPDPTAAQLRATLAVLIVHDGELVAERYAAGVDENTRLMSWSMAKSVLATLFGVASAQHRVSIDGPAAPREWRSGSDARRHITVDQLLRMSSGLAFDETYSATNEASVMLFARADAAHYAALRRLDAAPDSLWNYSSGTTNILSRLLARAVARKGDLREWAHRKLFARIGAHSALIDADASGTLIFSSFAYMTGRDWARFGELHRLDGVWFGERILPEGWVEYVTTPTPPSNGEYGAHWWLNRGSFEDPQTPEWPALPRDTYAARGLSGQHVMVIPSEKLVIVRLGLTTPDASNGTAELAEAIVAHYRGAN